MNGYSDQFTNEGGKEPEPAMNIADFERRLKEVQPSLRTILER